MKNLSQEDHNKLNMLLQKKQKFVQKALEDVQKNKYKQASFMFSLESGLE